MNSSKTPHSERDQNLNGFGERIYTNNQGNSSTGPFAGKLGSVTMSSRFVKPDCHTSSYMVEEIPKIPSPVIRVVDDTVQLFNINAQAISNEVNTLETNKSTLNADAKPFYPAVRATQVTVMSGQHFYTPIDFSSQLNTNANKTFSRSTGGPRASETYIYWSTCSQNTNANALVEIHDLQNVAPNIYRCTVANLNARLEFDHGRIQGEIIDKKKFSYMTDSDLRIAEPVERLDEHVLAFENKVNQERSYKPDSYNVTQKYARNECSNVTIGHGKTISDDGELLKTDEYVSFMRHNNQFGKSDNRKSNDTTDPTLIIKNKPQMVAKLETACIHLYIFLGFLAYFTFVMFCYFITPL